MVPKTAQKDSVVSEEEKGISYQGLTVIRGKRHCKIIDETKDDEVVFRTTNVRDAEHYLELIEERDRLQKLLDARGVAPHRIYLLAIDESKRGRVNAEQLPASEVVIVAKADDALVVRHLEDGREEIVEVEEIEPIEGGSYLQGPDVSDESVQVIVRYDREDEVMNIAVFRQAENMGAVVTQWASAEERPDSEYQAGLVHTQGDVMLFRAESSLED